MRKRKIYTKSEMALLEVAKKMPPLLNVLPNHDFNVEESEVINWLVNQPEAKLFLLNFVGRRKKDKVIEMIEPGKWQGVDYVEHDGSFSNCSVCNDRTCTDGHCSWDY